jgi:phosphate starvation-inducible PhoH-like protein
MGKAVTLTKPQIDFCPKTQQQSELFHQLKHNNLLVANGPAGTGKTFTVCSQAAIWLVGGHIDRVVLARANVPTGKSLGAIPGTLEEKLEPWVLPMTDVLRGQMGRAYYEHAVSKGKIETVAFETIRGRSFDNSMILIDEAQQLTMEEIKAITTRIGENSVLVFMGDPKQSDKANATGLVKFVSLFSNNMIDKTCVVEFDLDDIVRSDTCANMVRMFYKEGI